MKKRVRRHHKQPVKRKSKKRVIHRKRRVKPLHQTGKTHNRQDRTRHAKKPGWRKSRHNKKYYEARRNRSDRGQWL